MKKTTGETVTAVLAGGGSRGKLVYSAYALEHPEELQIVAVAEADPARRSVIQELHGLPDNRCYSSAEAMFAEEKAAQLAIIATQDAQHVAHATAAIEKGYDLILEKPISPSMEECRSLLALAESKGTRVSVTHVLRYAPFYGKLKELIDSGELGRVICIEASENVGYWHMAHSFVRGAWRNTAQSSPIILAKSCHDLDLMVWLTDSNCHSLSSAGGLSWYRKENMPADATPYCYGGCAAKKDCPYDAEKIYMLNPETGFDHVGAGLLQWAVTTAQSRDEIEQALKTSPYGRCVYACDNDVADNQALCAKMENGITISFLLSGFSQQNHRKIHIHGSLADVEGNLDEETLYLRRFGQQAVSIPIVAPGGTQGHGGGDSRMVADILACQRGERSTTMTTLRKSMESHYMAFAAEYSRLNDGKMVLMDAFTGRSK